MYNGENFIPKIKLGVYKGAFLCYTKNVEGLQRALFFVLCRFFAGQVGVIARGAKCKMQSARLGFIGMLKKFLCL